KKPLRAHRRWAQRTLTCPRARLYIGGHVGTVPVTNPGNSRVESTRERVEHMAEPTPRKRGRRSARQAGSRFERQIADYLRDHIDDRIDRRVTNGNKDRGDIGGMRLSPALGGGRIAAECK